MGSMSSVAPSPTTGGKTAQPSMGQPNQYAQGGDMSPSPQPIPTASAPQHNPAQSNFNSMMQPSWDNAQVGQQNPFGKGSGGGKGFSSSQSGGQPSGKGA